MSSMSRKAKTTATTKQKRHEGKSQKPSPVHVSLDNTFSLIEGHPAPGRKSVT
jgi:hypothetical protein